MFRPAIATIMVVLTTVPVYAQQPQQPWAPVLRCIDAEGKVEYRATACPADSREKVVVAMTSTGEKSASDTSVIDASAATPNAGIRRRTNISEERKQALDVAERYAAEARAARPQVAVQVLPLPPAK